MRGKGLFLSCSFLLLLATSTCRADDSKDEPRYKGKPLSTWLKALEDKDEKVRVEAVIAMESFGPRAKAAIPRLIPMLKDAEENIALWAGYALRKIGKEAVPALIEAAKSKDMALRGNAIGTLGSIGREAKDALPLILKVAEHSDPFMRRAAICAAAGVAPDSDKALSAVIRALDDEDQDVAIGAACSLTYFGPEARKALPELAHMLKHKNRERRKQAMGTLGNIAMKNGRKMQEATPVLLRAWKDEDSWVRYIAVKTLGTVRAPAKDAVPILLEALKDPRGDMQAAAKESLYFIDPERVEQFRLTSPVGRIQDPRKQARAALQLLFESKDYNNELRWLPKQLRHTLSPTARKYLTGILLANLTSRRELKVENIAPTSIPSRVAAGKMRSYGFGGDWLTQDIFLESGRSAWALEGLLRRKLPTFNEEVNRDAKKLKRHIAQATLEAIEATLGEENPKKPWFSLLPQPPYFHEDYPCGAVP
jgi:HEAT repeat protein